MKRADEKTVHMDDVNMTVIQAELIGTSDLILNKKARSYEEAEKYKQTHPKGTVMPKALDQPYCLWERLITSITWDKPIVYHDDDYSKYTEEEWNGYMLNNNPCILSAAFAGAMGEAFKTFGYKDSTGKAGTDFRRAIVFTSPKHKITFDSYRYEQKLVPNNGINRTNVVAQYNVFSGWQCELELACADTVFPYETIVDLIRTTGKFIGIGTQRKNGYGHWDLGNVSVIQTGGDA